MTQKNTIFGDYVKHVQFDVDGGYLEATVCTTENDLRGIWISLGTVAGTSEGFIQIFCGASDGATLLDMHVPNVATNTDIPVGMNFPGDGIAATATSIMVASQIEAVTIYYSEPGISYR